MDILHLVDRLEELFNESRTVPFTRNVVVDEDKMLDLIDQMRVGRLAPDVLIDIKKLKELNVLSAGADGLHVGAAWVRSGAADYLSTGRAFTGCSGRLLSNPSVVLKASSCCFETVIGRFMTTQRTPSLQGGVVSDPLYR